MKIIYLGDAAAHHLRRWAKYFAGQGHEVHIITFNPDFLDGYDPVHLHLVKKWFLHPSLFTRSLNLIPMIIDLNRLIGNINPDIIHSHSAAGYAWLTMLTGFHPFVVTPWGNDVLIEVQSSRIAKYFTRRALINSDLITCDGTNTKNAMINLGVDPTKIQLIIFGVDVRKFQRGLRNNYIREKFSLQNSKIVISTRTLNPIHNLETFIRSIPLVLKSQPGSRFILVGHGSEQEYLLNLSKSLNVFDSIIFPGKIEEADMIAFLQASDIYVSTSLSESGLAASTAEAMACELPIINTDTGDIRLWIENHNGDFIIPTRDPQILAEKIIYLLEHQEDRIRFGKNNRKIIEERNNYYTEMEKMLNLYRDLADRKKHSVLS